MNNTVFLQYKNKKILYTDLRGLKPEQVYENFSESCKMIAELTEPVLALSNWSGVPMDKKATEIGKEWAPKMGPKMIKTAIVVNSSLQEGMINLFNMATGQKSRAFTTEETAKEWLVS